ncbi:RNA polymerase sigma factor [Dyadobacter sp. CY323]|uniref:RNA polymerase sigma factor n=1 Tax=Dyadobacter sp. CY323 TaxID=2907302 RepID=UPI001F3E9749|nr:sigma-70 family RNA polymerase sigma factor [Dyadobacter sp. CY323]MCE6989774.1 sigma-70 family RNA polymerase sigma factor [Dyadobacter sp. CY323]
MSDDSEAELWLKFREGSEDAYASIYEKFAPVLFTYGYRLSPDEDLVKDCIQDLFVNLWLSRRKLSATDSIKFYLFRSLRREIFHKSNSQKQWQHGFTEAFSDTEPSFEDQWIKGEEEQGRSAALTKMFSHLSVRQREIIFFRFFEDMSFDEISRLMEITPRAAYKLVYRALDAIRDSLDLRSIKK